MKYVKMLGLAALAAALMAFVVAGTASATELTNGSGMVTTGSTIASAAEGTTTLHPPIGDIECSGSEVEGTTSNTGGSTETVSGNISKLTFTGCNAEVVVIEKGSLEIHTKTASADNNGTLTSTGAKVTVTFVGFHCIFTTNSTDIGTVTGSATTGGNATLDIEATIPRTGGRSGAFCGSTAQWTGSYSVSNPSPLNID
jgi:hypothetical protein